MSEIITVIAQLSTIVQALTANAASTQEAINDLTDLQAQLVAGIDATIATLQAAQAKTDGYLNAFCLNHQGQSLRDSLHREFLRVPGGRPDGLADPGHEP